jgi:polyferredoxin
MDQMAYPRGLIRYTTENALAGKRVRVLRPRTIAYATLLLALFSGFAWSVTHRSMLLAEIIRDRNALWRPGPAGTIENSYTVKLVNKGDHEIELALRIAEPGYSIVGEHEFEVDAGNVASLPLTLRAQAGAVHGRNDITLEFAARREKDDDHEHDGDVGSAESVRVTTRFFAPESP